MRKLESFDEKREAFMESDIPSEKIAQQGENPNIVLKLTHPQGKAILKALAAQWHYCDRARGLADNQDHYDFYLSQQQEIEPVMEVLRMVVKA